MIATTVTIPTLAWALPLTLLTCLAWGWAWQRTVVPLFRKVAINKALKALQSEAGLSRDEAIERIEAWKKDGWLG